MAKETVTEKEILSIDAAGQTLGHLAVKIAVALRGKDRPTFLPYKNEGVKVEVINTDDIKITGNKLKKKMYYRHSGYPGGLKEAPLERLMEKDSREVVRKAVYGMLPANKLRRDYLNNLELYKKDK